MRSLKKDGRQKLPGGIWVLGFVSMLMDISSEMVHSLLPIFMTATLGVPVVMIGMIEGVAESAAAITKVFSGAISDYFGKRKFLAVIGYGLSAATKPIFPMATSVGWVFSARFLDRIGKGIRGAPRDALVADISPPQLLGAAYGLRQSLDSVGALIGPLLAVLLMLWVANDIQTVLWIAVGPAFLAVLLLIVALREPESRDDSGGPGIQLAVTEFKRLPFRYWRVVLLGAVFTLARFSEAFLILRAGDLGLTLSLVPVIMIVMNLTYSIFAYPAGVLGDRLSARRLLVSGLCVLIIADIVLAVAASPRMAFVGAALWGMHMALTQGLLSKLVADTAPHELRGTAFGVFNLVSGGALLLASVIAGSVWSMLGASATFLVGASFAALAATGLLFHRPIARAAGLGSSD